MTTHKDATGAPRVEFKAGGTIIERLEAIGIYVPDQPKAHRMMEAARLDLSLHAPEWRIKIAWIRRLLSENWKVFAPDKFKSVAFCYGGNPPEHVARRIQKIRKELPHANCQIHAKYNDPFFTVDGVIVFAWQQMGIDFLQTFEIDLT